jgi:hypothetical protein
LEENKRGLKMKAYIANRVNVGERNKINVYAISVDEGLTIFFQCIGDRRGKIVNK